MCHGGAEYLSGEYRGEPEIQSEVFKPHSEDWEIIGFAFVYPILLQRQPRISPSTEGEYFLTRPSILGSGHLTVSERA